MMPVKDLSLYRPNVGIMLLNQRGNVFVAQRLDSVGPAWQMPQGGIDAGENVITAALRELEEETSIRDVQVIRESQSWLFYDLPKDIQPQVWDGRFLGQRQKWVLMKYLGEEAHINLSTSHPEFSAWQWVAPQDLPALAVSFKKEIYQGILREFAPEINLF